MNPIDPSHIQYGTLYHGPGSKANRPSFRLKMLSMEQFKKVEAAKKYLIEQGIKCVLQTDIVQTQQLQMQNAFTAMQKQQAWALMCRIYIGSVNITVNEDMLRTTFLPFGPIKMLSVNIDPATGKHKGFAFLEYEAPEGALLAVEQLNGVVLGGKGIKVGRPTNMPQAQAMVDQHFKESKDSARIYVASIHPALQDNDLISVFSPFGNVVSCELPRDLNGKHKGFAYMEFDKKQSALDAIAALHLFELGGQKLRVGKAITQHNPDLDEAPLSIKLKVRQSLNLYRKNKNNHGDSNKNNKNDKNNNNNNNKEAGDAKKTDADVINSNNNSNNNDNNGDNNKENNKKDLKSDNNTNGETPSETPATVPTETPLINGNADVQTPDDNTNRTEEKTETATAEPTTTTEPTIVANGEDLKVHTVLLLENVVGADEVDDDLEEEMKEECSNYGDITGIKIVIKKPDDEKGEDQVQIYISYTDPTNTSKAQEALNLRFFAGRQIIASIVSSMPS